MRKQYKIFHEQTKKLVLETACRYDFEDFDKDLFNLFNQELNIIVACNKDGIIGVDGKIPWRYSEDLKFFKKITMNSSLIMGRKTWESIARKLPGRDMIVVSKGIYTSDIFQFVKSIDQAIEVSDPGQNIWVIGGGEIYDQVLREHNHYGVNKIFLTMVPDNINIRLAKNVAYFPLKLLENFQLVHETYLNDNLIVKEYWSKNVF